MKTLATLFMLIAWLGVSTVEASDTHVIKVYGGSQYDSRDWPEVVPPGLAALRRAAGSGFRAFHICETATGQYEYCGCPKPVVSWWGRHNATRVLYIDGKSHAQMVAVIRSGQCRWEQAAASW